MRPFKQSVVFLVTLAVASCFGRSAWALDVGVSAYFEQGEVSRGYGGQVALTVPFERWLLPVIPSEASLDAQAREPLWDEHWDRLAQAPETHDPAAGEDAAVETQAAADRSAVDRSAGADAAVSSAEPAGAEPWRLSSQVMHALVAAAIATQLHAEQRLARLADRARSSAWLPELKLRAGRNTDQTLRLTPTTDEPDRWQLTGGADLRFEGEVRWQFDRLVFASEEVSVERLRLAAEQQRARWVERVLEQVLRWQGAVVRSADPALDPSKRLEATVQAVHAGHSLDVLTAGWFSQNVRW